MGTHNTSGGGGTHNISVGTHIIPPWERGDNTSMGRGAQWGRCWYNVVHVGMLCSDHAIVVEFQHLSSSQPDQTRSITLDVSAEGHWEGGHYLESPHTTVVYTF